MTPTVYSKCHNPVTVNSIRKGRTESITSEPVHTQLSNKKSDSFQPVVEACLVESTISRLTDNLFILKINRLI